MRLGIIADVHGNLLALEAVLKRLEALGCARIVNLGDTLSGPLQALETADRLMAGDFLTVRGNHDRMLVDREVSKMGPSDASAFGLIRGQHIMWLRSLPVEASIEDIYLCHATPRNDSAYLIETVIPGRGEIRLASQGEMRARLIGVPENAKVVLHGHTHVPRLVTLDGRLLVNPGSVGLPAYDASSISPHYMEVGSPHARFAVLDRKGGGQWQAEFHAVEYDWDAASRLAAERNRPEWAHALATGYALRAG